MKNIAYMCIALITLPVTLFAGGQAESGRGQAMDGIDAGQLLPVGALDSANYLEDFAFEKSNTTRFPLDFHVDLLKNAVWERGEDISVRISLMTNAERYFRTVPGNYVIYVQNPELFGSETFRNYLKGELLKHKAMRFFFFNPVDGTLLSVKNSADMAAGTKALSAQKKEYTHNVLLQRLLRAIEALDGGNRTRVLWVTDENITEKQTDANFFHFAVNVLGAGKTTFSYLGYGEVPDWSLLNANLLAYNGNSYYAKTDQELCKKITEDVAAFSKPAAEDIQVTVVWSDEVKELNTYYPEEYYPAVSGFYPSITNNRPCTVHYMGGMNFCMSKRFIHYIRIPPLQTLRKRTENREPANGKKYVIGKIYVKFFIPMQRKEYFLQKDMIVEFRDADQMTRLGDVSDRYVLADTIIQNTPLLVKEIAVLVGRKRNYLAAIQLVKIQKNLLERISTVRKDEAVAEDITLLDKCYELLFNQARTMNMVE